MEIMEFLVRVLAGIGAEMGIGLASDVLDSAASGR